jgi:hypothetical protein
MVHHCYISEACLQILLSDVVDREIAETGEDSLVIHHPLATQDGHSLEVLVPGLGARLAAAMHLDHLDALRRALLRLYARHGRRRLRHAVHQGLAFVHFSAQPEPLLTRNTR